MIGKLSAAKMRAAKAGHHGDGGGLWLRVRVVNARPPKAKDTFQRSWVFRYARHGVAHSMGLGTVEDVTLAEARDKARDCRRALQDGLDPIAQRRAAKGAAGGITFKDVAERYIASREGQWKNSVHRKQWTTTLATYVFPVFGDRPVAAVETDDVRRVLEPIWNTKHETATRVRGRIEAVLDYAKASEWRQGDNPARLRGHIAKLLGSRSQASKVEHHAALPWAEMAGFMADLRSQAGTAALALQFTILTAARTGEVIGATWEEIDPDAAAWTIPGARMKAGAEHRVALSLAALAVLEKVRPLGGRYVFPGAKADAPLSNMAMIATLRRMKRGELTVHGFRSTFRDWAAEATAHPRELAEAALAHTLRDKVEAAYRRGDLFEKRRLLMKEWAEYCK